MGVDILATLRKAMVGSFFGLLGWKVVWSMIGLIASKQSVKLQPCIFCSNSNPSPAPQLLQKYVPLPSLSSNLNLSVPSIHIGQGPCLFCKYLLSIPSAVNTPYHLPVTSSLLFMLVPYYLYLCLLFAFLICKCFI